MGSSRPQLLKYCVESLQDKILKFSSSSHRILLHEDFVLEKESRESIKYAKDKDVRVISHNPKIGVGPAMNSMFKNHIKSEYLLYLQDDWEFERIIEIDRLLWTMNQHQQINCITFSKYRNVKPGTLEELGVNEYNYKGLLLTLYDGWWFNPGIWRMSKVRKHWRFRDIRPEGYWQQSFFENRDGNIKLKDWCYNNVGSYFLGGKGDFRYVRHLGSSWRMADWRLEKGKPSGTLHWDFQSLTRDRAPWLEELPPRPLNQEIKLDSEGLGFYEKQPEYIKKMYKGGL